MTTKEAIQNEIVKLENEIKNTRWTSARQHLKKKLWNLQIKLSTLS
jgi:hypothetical protein